MKIYRILLISSSIFIDNSIINTLLQRNIIPILYNFSDKDTDYNSLLALIHNNYLPKTIIQSIGCMYHNPTPNSLKLFINDNEKSTLDTFNDAEYSHFSTFICALKHCYNITDFDIISCNIVNSTPNTALNVITTKVGVNITASTNATGTIGDWILENGDINLIDRYFKNKIKKLHILLGPIRADKPGNNILWYNPIGTVTIKNVDLIQFLYRYVQCVPLPPINISDTYCNEIKYILQNIRIKENNDSYIKYQYVAIAIIYIYNKFDINFSSNYICGSNINETFKLETVNETKINTITPTLINTITNTFKPEIVNNDKINTITTLSQDYIKQLFAPCFRTNLTMPYITDLIKCIYNVKNISGMSATTLDALGKIMFPNITNIYNSISTTANNLKPGGNSILIYPSII